MGTFREADHPRTTDGRFQAKTTRETDPDLDTNVAEAFRNPTFLEDHWVDFDIDEAGEGPDDPPNGLAATTTP